MLLYKAMIWNLSWEGRESIKNYTLKNTSFDTIIKFYKLWNLKLLDDKYLISYENWKKKLSATIFMLHWLENKGWVEGLQD